MWINSSRNGLLDVRSMFEFKIQDIIGGSLRGGYLQVVNIYPRPPNFSVYDMVSYPRPLNFSV